jgi:hypothetical protein
MTQESNVGFYAGSSAPPTMGARGYEFGPGENQLLRGLAGAMRFVAVFQTIVGALLLVLAVFSLLWGHFGEALGYGIESCLGLVLAGLLLGAAGRFRQVVETQGADIPHLMGALEQLRKFFNLQRVLLIIALVLLGVALALGVFLFQPRAASPHVTTPQTSVSVTR